ncbi:MAG: hypothetical protein ACHQK8_01250 [Bacteroidia bacterium]
MMVLISSCVQGYGPSGGGGDQCCTGNVLGKISFSPADSNWIPAGNLPLYFKNSNGFNTTFILNRTYKSTNPYDMVSKSQKCQCGTDYCYDYVSADEIKYSYVSNNLPYNFTYDKSVILTQHNTTFDTLAGYDVLSIKINGNSFDLPMNRISPKNYVHLDSVQLANKNYTDVFHVYTDSSLVDNTVIVPRGLFYAIGRGLIGFYLTNGELWSLY